MRGSFFGHGIVCADQKENTKDAPPGVHCNNGELQHLRDPLERWALVFEQVPSHPGGNPRAKYESICRRCYLLNRI